MSFALIKTAKPISAQRLHDAHVNVGIVVAHEAFAPKLDKIAKPVNVKIQQLLAQFRRQIGLRVIQERSDVVLQRAFAAALIIQEEWMAVAQHDVARLKIPVEKVIEVRGQQKLRQPAEVVFQRLFVEGNAGKPEKVILKIIQIPGDGLSIENGARIANFIIQIAARFDLKTRQNGHNFADRLQSLGD